MSDTLSLVLKHGSATINLDHLPKSSTISQLMELIEEKTGVMTRKQKLICKGKVITALRPTTTLEAAGIADGAKIMLLTTAGGAQSQGAAALQASQKAKFEAMKERLASGSGNLGRAAQTSTAVVPPATMSTRIAAWKKTGIAALRDLKLTQLPEELFTSDCAEALRVADMGGNQLITLPPSISQMSRLQKLRLSMNALTDSGMPWEALVSLTQLVVLALDHNKLTTLPECISKLGNLQKLAVDHNAIAALPESLGALTALRALNASNNALTELPSSLSSCLEMQEMDFSDNSIVNVPTSWGALTNLKTLLIKIFPPEILIGASSLSTLSLHGCPITIETLRETPGFDGLESRRKKKYDKQVDMKVLGQGGGFEEAADMVEWEHWGKDG